LASEVRALSKCKTAKDVGMLFLKKGFEKAKKLRNREESCDKRPLGFEAIE